MEILNWISKNNDEAFLLGVGILIALGLVLDYFKSIINGK